MAFTDDDHASAARAGQNDGNDDNNDMSVDDNHDNHFMKLGILHKTKPRRMASFAGKNYQRLRSLHRPSSQHEKQNFPILGNISCSATTFYASSNDLNSSKVGQLSLLCGFRLNYTFPVGIGLALCEARDDSYFAFNRLLLDNKR